MRLNNPKTKRGQAAKSEFHYEGLKNHPFVIPVTTFLVLFFMSIVGFIGLGGQTIQASDSRVVSININGEQQTLPTRAPTVGDLLKRLGVETKPDDFVKPSLDTKILEDNMEITVNQAKSIMVVDGDKKTVTYTAEIEPRSVAKAAGVVVYPEDLLTKEAAIESPTEVLREGIVASERIVINRATPAHINLYGTPITVRTRATTVGELLREKNISPGEGDTVQPALDTVLTQNTQVFLIRLGKQVQTIEETIAMPIETINDATVAAGQTVVRQAGAPGKKVVTYELDLTNNKETGRRVIQEVLVSAPVKQVLAKGAQVVITGSKADWLVAAGISPADYGAVDHIISKESGWCPTKWQGEYGACPAYHGAPTSSGLGYGLCQSTPASKMATAGADWATNPVTQLRWCDSYARKYGGWQGAYRFWSVNRWW